MSGTNSSLAIPDLRSTFNGKVIAPGDANYDAARAVFPGGFEARPAVIIQVTDAKDVARGFEIARETGRDLYVRCGGHTRMGVGDDGIVLDVRALKDLDVDVKARTVWVGAGSTAAEVAEALSEHGLVIGFGDTGSVGVGGITLGGGIGFLVRKFGMTIDNLLAAEIVTPDGQALEVDADNHPDLFWAIRGGGGNFGVVTRFKFKLHELPEVVGGILVLPATVDTIVGFVEQAQAAPDELSTIANVMVAPPMPFLPEGLHGKLIVMALMTYAGPAEEGQRVLAPFREIAEPLADMLRPMKYAEMFPPEDDSYHPTAVAETMFLDSIGEAEAETILRFLNDSDAPVRVAQLRPLGGALARVESGATAFAHRQRRFMVNLASFYVGPEDKPVREEWLARFTAAMRQGEDGAYVGFLDFPDAAAARRAYPAATWERLAGVKLRYDPDNLLRSNQNVTPAGRG